MRASCATSSEPVAGTRRTSSSWMSTRTAVVGAAQAKASGAISARHAIRRLFITLRRYGITTMTCDVAITRQVSAELSICCHAYRPGRKSATVPHVTSLTPVSQVAW